MFRCLLLASVLAFAGTTAPDARAADAANGQRLAQSHCAACHMIARQTRREVANSPPFAVIARKYKFDAEVITHVIAGPHPKMNFSPDLRQAADIAAYIVTLKH